MAKQKEKIGNPLKDTFNYLKNDQPKAGQRELSEIAEMKRKAEEEAPEEPKELTPLMEMFANRNKQKSIFFDKLTHRQIISIKGDTGIDIKDFVYFATVNEINRLFPDGNMADEEALERLKKEFIEKFGVLKLPKKKKDEE